MKVQMVFVNSASYAAKPLSQGSLHSNSYSQLMDKADVSDAGAGGSPGSHLSWDESLQCQLKAFDTAKYFHCLNGWRW